VKLWVTLEGREAEVEFHTEGERLLLEVEGRKVDADFHRLPDGEVWSVIVDGRSYEVRITPNGNGALDVSLAGASFPVEVRHPIEKVLQAVKRAGGSHDGETIAAPMPGLLVSMRVAKGDLVKPGQSVAVVEAMKMQNELVARHGGEVSEILAAERASVSAGQPLVRLKAVPA
jgi:biotin carboxyl carrier protein